MTTGRLTPLQHRILAVLADLDPPWTLTGGGALVGVHLGHRETRDLQVQFDPRAVPEALDSSSEREARQSLARALLVQCGDEPFEPLAFCKWARICAFEHPGSRATYFSTRSYRPRSSRRNQFSESRPFRATVVGGSAMVTSNRGATRKPAWSSVGLGGQGLPDVLGGLVAGALEGDESPGGPGWSPRRPRLGPGRRAGPGRAPSGGRVPGAPRRPPGLPGRPPRPWSGRSASISSGPAGCRGER